MAICIFRCIPFSLSAPHTQAFFYYFFLLRFQRVRLAARPHPGIVLSMGPPILVGLGEPEPGDLVIVVFCVIGLHLFALNVLYPKLLGSRLRINPLAVTLALLFWGAVWARSDPCSPSQSRARSRSSSTTSSR